MARKLWRGNTGSSVRELQQKLNQNGYHLDEDGVFGSNTYRAVVDYQKRISCWWTAWWATRPGGA